MTAVFAKTGWTRTVETTKPTRSTNRCHVNVSKQTTAVFPFGTKLKRKYPLGGIYIEKGLYEMYVILIP